MSIEIDDLIHQPVRTKIMAYLGNRGETDFSELKRALELSDGHMSTHIKKLIEGEYVEMTKAFIDNKPKTTYKLSKLGRRRLVKYLENLKALIET